MTALKTVKNFESDFKLHWGAVVMSCRFAKAIRSSIIISSLCVCALAYAQRWSEEQANAWYAQEPWLVGSDFIPANAINQLEMWQKPTFDPQEIDKELGWAEGLGMNTMRVFLHDLLWQQDQAGFRS